MEDLTKKYKLLRRYPLHRWMKKRRKYIFYHCDEKWVYPTTFEALKVAITQPPVLKLLDFSQNFTIECDVSGVGLGAVLMRNGQPLACFSKVLKGKALLLSAYENEFLALVSAVGKMRPYLARNLRLKLINRHFNIFWSKN